MSIIQHIAKRLPSYVNLGTANGSGDSTDFFSYPVAAKPSSTRRIVATMIARRNTDLGASLSTLTFSDGTNTIPATIHTQDTAGDGSANTSVMVAIASALVPTDNYNRIIHTGAYDAYVFDLLAIYGRNTFSTGASAATHSNVSSRQLNISNTLGARIIAAAGGFSTVTSNGSSWNHGLELCDFSDGNVLNNTIIDDRPPTQVSEPYICTFPGTLTASGIAAVLFT